MRTVLQFSGGKDSLACLYLLRPRWDEITVAWVNTGAAFPETIEQMQEIQKLVPHFLEIRSNQSIANAGFPADVVPLDVGFQSRYACCAHALWFPMMRAMNEMGATEIIRGQKKADSIKGPIRDGAVIDGVTYRFPLEDWTDADVYAYLKEVHAKLPPNYTEMHTSLDCWNCTAYLSENREKLGYMKRIHPEKFEIVNQRIRALRTAIHQQSAPIMEFQ